MKFYKVVLSNRQEVVLDQQDYDKLCAGLNSGSFVQLKKAVVNPSFVMLIVPISQKEALDAEAPPRKTEGYLDEERGVFVVTKDEHPVPTQLTDAFRAE